MATNSVIQELIELRMKALREASESRDVEELMSWYSKEGLFEDPVAGVSHVGVDAVRAFYTMAYQALPRFQIIEGKTTGFTPEFVASELVCEGVSAFDLAEKDVKAGETLEFKGVSLFWWKWEGSGDEWDGTLTDEAIRGWKIIREHVYVTTRKKELE